MKRIRKAVAAIIVLALLAALTLPAAADTLSGISVSINNNIVFESSKIEYEGGTVLVPAKELAEALGGTFFYKQADTTGTVKLGENELVFRLENSIARLNGKNIQSPAAMKVAGSRFMVPAEFAASKLGAEVVMNTYKNILMIFQPEDGRLVYKVFSGDSLWRISQLFGVSITSIKQMNNLTSDIIYAGQKLAVKNLSPFSQITPAYTTKNATLRSGAGFEYGAISYVISGTDITVVGKLGDWFKVVTPKGNGYMYYTVMAVKQDITDNAPNSQYFGKHIPVDTTANYLTYQSYTIQKGDNLWSIAERFGIPDYELAAANNMSTGTMIYIGQVIRIPVHNVPVKVTSGPEYGEVLDWAKEAQYVFSIGKIGKLIDMETGKSFMVKRTIGANHADTETLTLNDTQIMKEIFGGSWSWDRKPLILEVEGRRFAVSISGMPHAGVDGVPFMQNVANRSDNWGYGPNYDRISGNGMNGHFDVYFLNCLRHKDNLIDSSHQYNVMLAGGLR